MIKFKRWLDIIKRSLAYTLQHEQQLLHLQLLTKHHSQEMEVFCTELFEIVVKFATEEVRNGIKLDEILIKLRNRLDIPND